MAVPGVSLRAAHVLVRLALAGVLLWAGIAKAMDRQTAILAVDAYDVLPSSFVEPVATLLPWAEIGLAALLLLGLFVRQAGIGTMVLTAAFLVAMGQAKARGLAIDCGCFGGGGRGEGVTWLDIGRDVAFLAMAGWLALRPTGPFQLDGFLGGGDVQDEGEARLVQG